MPNIENLQQLRRVVNDAPDELLHMRAVVEKAGCGTARCAIGWAIIDPWFQANTKINDILPANWSSTSLCAKPSEFHAGVNLTRVDQLAELFGISKESVNNLFALDLCQYEDPHAVSKAEVLDNIDLLIAGFHAVEYAAARDEGEE